MVSIETLIEEGADAPGVPVVTALRPPRFEIETERAEFIMYLEEYGYAVVRGVADARQCVEVKSKMWDFLEGVPGTAVRRNDVKTWGLKGDWVPSRTNGIINGFGFGQCPAMWQLRLLPKVKAAFAAIWGTDDLIVSYDGGNVFLPYEYNREWRTCGGWYHVDQNYLRPRRQGRVCVQGLVTLYDANEKTGGLVVVPKSHKLHKEFCERNPLAKSMGDFVPIPVGDQVLAGGASLVCAEAGDMIVWDSRTIHCNTPSLTIADEATAMVAGTAADAMGTDSGGAFAAGKTSSDGGCDGGEAKDGSRDKADKDWELIRMVGYVCMTPAKAATQDTLAKRVDAYVNHISTSHWPHDFVGAGKALPDTPPHDVDAIGPEQRKLIGLDRPWGERICFLM